MGASGGPSQRKKTNEYTVPPPSRFLPAEIFPRIRFCLIVVWGQFLLSTFKPNKSREAASVEALYLAQAPWLRPPQTSMTWLRPFLQSGILRELVARLFRPSAGHLFGQQHLAHIQQARETCTNFVVVAAAAAVVDNVVGVFGSNGPLRRWGRRRR